MNSITLWVYNSLFWNSNQVFDESLSQNTLLYVLEFKLTGLDWTFYPIFRFIQMQFNQTQGFLMVAPIKIPFVFPIFIAKIFRFPNFAECNFLG